MIVEMGHFALALALALSIAQSFLGGAKATAPHFALFAQMAARAHLALFGLIACGILALAYAFMSSDFSLALVATHSHSTKPLAYKIAALWGNHEGSLLLWVFFLALFACPAAFQSFSQKKEKKEARLLYARILSVQGALISAFLGFMLFTSNPFLRLFPPPFQGQGLNPILQDPALAIHPPILYAGYVGFSMAFAYALALLWSQDTDKLHLWAASLRRYVQTAWALLTAGVVLGAWWAYRELGWGGFWFWDPVENAALMPWLMGTALLHAIMMTARNGTALFWTLLLSILTFALSVLGTFLTRSGILVSVHSFASDPSRGIVILALLALILLIALAMFFLRAPRLVLEPRQNFHPISREGALTMNSLFLIASCATILIGTLYPAFLDALGYEPISVGPPYFLQSFIPLIIPILLLMPLAPFLPWQKADLSQLLPRLAAAFIAALSAFLLLYLFSEPSMLAPAIGGAFGIWIVGGALSRFLDAPPPDRKRLLPMLLGHAGLGILVMGAVAASAAQKEKLANLKVGEETFFAGYRIVLEDVHSVQGPDYHAWRARLRLHKEGSVQTLLPETRNYIARPTATNESAILTEWLPLADLHAILGEENADGARALQFYRNPLAPLIWLGAALMALGGALGAAFGRGFGRSMRKRETPPEKHHQRNAL